MIARPLIIIAGLFTLATCARPTAPALPGAWPEEPSAYPQAHKAWTRHGVVRAGYDQVLEVHATFKAPAWRAAYVEHTATTQALSPQGRERLLQEQRQAASEEPYEVELLVATHDWAYNDLYKGDKSIWRITLVNDRGDEVEPLSIERDRRPQEVVRALFPDLSDFAEPYVVRFPRTLDVLEPGSFTLVMASHLGAARLVWRVR